MTERQPDPGDRLPRPRQVRCATAARLGFTFVFPFIFIGILGGSFQAQPRRGDFGFNFIGVHLHRRASGRRCSSRPPTGIISLIEDRENDFSQEIFVSPISRYSIVFGKILGESLVALTQGSAIVAVRPRARRADLGAADLLGAGAGRVWSPACSAARSASWCCRNLSSQRAASQIFPFIMLPQFFLAGVFNPIKVLPWYLELLSLISPMRYAVDLAARRLLRRAARVRRRWCSSAAAGQPGGHGSHVRRLPGPGNSLFVRQETNR